MRFSTFLSVVLCAVCLGSLQRSASGEVKTGPVKLVESQFPPEGPANLTIGKTVQVTARFFVHDFFGSKIIDGGAHVKNTSAKPMFCCLNLAFFDKAGHLLGCVSQSSMNDGLKPGEQTQFGSMLITLPEAEIKNVASYQAAFFESDKKF